MPQSLENYKLATLLFFRLLLIIFTSSMVILLVITLSSSWASPTPKLEVMVGSGWLSISWKCQPIVCSALLELSGSAYPWLAPFLSGVLSFGLILFELCNFSLIDKLPWSFLDSVVAFLRPILRSLTSWSSPRRTKRFCSYSIKALTTVGSLSFSIAQSHILLKMSPFYNSHSHSLLV